MCHAQLGRLWRYTARQSWMCFGTVIASILRDGFVQEALGEMLEALGYLGARARAQGQEPWHDCVGEVG